MRVADQQNSARCDPGPPPENDRPGFPHYSIRLHFFCEESGRSSNLISPIACITIAGQTAGVLGFRSRNFIRCHRDRGRGLETGGPRPAYRSRTTFGRPLRRERLFLSSLPPELAVSKFLPTAPETKLPCTEHRTQVPDPAAIRNCVRRSTGENVASNTLED